MTRLFAVTALYDIGRAKVGRPLEHYVEWLNATLRLPVPFVVFLDPSISVESINLKPSDRIIQVPLQSFRPFRWSAQVARVNEDSSSTDRVLRSALA